MNSLFSRLFRSTIVLGLSTCSAASLVADDAEGVVRISTPKSSAAAKDNITQVNALQMSDGCTAAAAPAGPSCTATAPNCAAPAQGCTGAVASAPTDVYCESCPPLRRGQIRRALRQADSWGGGAGNGNDWCDDGSGYGPGPGYGYGNGVGYGGGMGLGGGMGYGEGIGHGGGLGHGGGRFGRRGSCPPGGCSTHNAALGYLRCKFGYFIPTGGGGKGAPVMGHYTRTYPVDPHYSDPRDGQMYAAQGYGIPMAVPLAPIVGHTYDYSWGVPSSRLTPVSHPAY